MGLKSCFICCKECTSNPVISKGKENYRNDSPGTADEGKYINSHLQVIFLLRKLLEIPEDTCCKLLQRFGNPDLWIEYCHSCSILVEQSQQIFDQMASLEKHYEKLRNGIKSTILKSQKIFDYESQCEAIVRSHIITKDIDYFIDTFKTEADKGEPTIEDSDNQIESICLQISPSEEQYSYVNYEQPLVICHSNAWEQEVETPETNTIPTISYKNTDECNLNGCNFSGKAEPLDYENVASVEDECYDVQETDELQMDQDSLNIHMEQSNSSVPQYPSCRICGETFENIRDLKTHENKHSLKGPHECLICGKIVSNSHNLLMHVKSHNNDEKFNCEICKKSFTYKHALKRHLLIHTGERPFKCNFCERYFSRQDSLKAHISTHSTPHSVP